MYHKKLKRVKMQYSVKVLTSMFMTSPLIYFIKHPDPYYENGTFQVKKLTTS